MFTGIIESLAEVVQIRHEGSNVHFTLASPLSAGLKIDQSLAHDGVCLTVVALGEQSHTVTAVYETLQKTNLGSWHIGKKVNLERALRTDARLDGHFVQGHVDGVGRCEAVEPQNGSWYYRFSFTPSPQALVVQKGSVCVNGVSLTVVDASESGFSVAIIPYTYEHTNFKNIQTGNSVNIEFDIIGKYIAALHQRQRHT